MAKLSPLSQCLQTSIVHKRYFPAEPRCSSVLQNSRHLFARQARFGPTEAPAGALHYANASSPEGLSVESYLDTGNHGSFERTVEPTVLSFAVDRLPTSA
jgi:hypothetical protein